ncbi:MAG: BON domain-containing protein, partial [Gammaproteobacteria bacterium]
MSILDFAKNLGRQVFDRDDVAAEKIKETMEINLSPIKDLSVEFDDGVVTLCGECMSPADRERAVLVAGNIEGVEKVVAND